MVYGEYDWYCDIVLYTDILMEEIIEHNLACQTNCIVSLASY